MSDLRRRSFAKSLTYRVITIAADIAIIYPLTHRVDLTIAVTLITNIASTTLYYLHERSWSYVQWGRRS
jgi:uncharacterized membrane protein